MRRLRSQDKDDIDDAFYTGFEDVDTTKDKGKDIPLRTKSSDSLARDASIWKHDNDRDESVAQVRRRHMSSTELVEKTEMDSEDSTASDLTLMDEIVLLGLKDKAGYLSFLNDTISYVLRGCILLELTFRRRIRLVKSSKPFHERTVEVGDAHATGEVLLDEALRWIKSEKHSLSTWMDLLSGETWNPLKASFQLKQVRERIAKGLVDKGILRTSKQSFLLFDMPVHPLADNRVKVDLIKRIIAYLQSRMNTSKTAIDWRDTALIASAYTSQVLETSLSKRLRGSELSSFMKTAQELLHSTARMQKEVTDPVHEVVCAVLAVFCRIDTLVY